MKPLIAVAISGGVDSLTAAYLLKQQGHQVIGIHFLTGYGREYAMTPISDQLGIDIHIVDCSAAFQSVVADYFIRTYQAGKTPNPCLICNAEIKFGVVLNIAKHLGASALATGHYARIAHSLSPDRKQFHLLKGIDPQKDQSYFLAFLTQEHLSHALFPLGNMTKSQVRELAATYGLKPFTDRESQDVCFIHGKTYHEFLDAQKGFWSGPGIIEDVRGRRLGEHQGLHRFTVGQRRGINCPASEPYYVVRIDAAQNRLVVGCKTDLLTSECRIRHINWITAPPHVPIPVHTRVRYRHHASPSLLIPQENHTAVVRFVQPQAAVTPGQGAVFYVGDEVIGGGWIE